MDRSDIIYLISFTRTQDSLGVWHETSTERKVFCEVTSITMSEWFEGGRNGLNPAYRFRMFAPDYNGEQEARYKGEVYAIYRTYRDRNEIIDLYVELKKGVKASMANSSQVGTGEADYMDLNG